MLTSAVKKGSQVAVSGTRFGTYKLIEVERVSSKHIFALNGLWFRLDGILDSAGGSTMELHDVTPEIEAIVLREARIAHLKDFPWERMSDEFLGELYQFLKSKGFDAVS